MKQSLCCNNSCVAALMLSSLFQNKKNVLISWLNLFSASEASHFFFLFFLHITPQPLGLRDQRCFILVEKAPQPRCSGSKLDRKWPFCLFVFFFPFQQPFIPLNLRHSNCQIKVEIKGAEFIMEITMGRVNTTWEETGGGETWEEGTLGYVF